MSDEVFTPLVDSFGRTGVIVGLAESCPPTVAAKLVEQLTERFPGVTFAVIDQCSALTTFNFDDEATP